MLGSRFTTLRHRSSLVVGQPCGVKRIDLVLQSHVRFVLQRHIRGESNQGYPCQCPISRLLFPDSGPTLFSDRG